MMGLKYLFPIIHLIPQSYRYFGYVLLFLGMAMVVSTRIKFKKKATEINTFKEPISLVTEGLFNFSRNPTYLGMVSTLIGIWILLGALSSLIGVLLFFAIANYYYIPYEEKKMEQIFGMDYLNYKSKVRRWL